MLVLLAGAVVVWLSLASLPALAKDGECPEPTGGGICAELCEVDDDCDGLQKCCFNGCGHVCIDPVRLCDPVCQNGGTCTVENRCECPDGYTGEACEIAAAKVPAVSQHPLLWVMAAMALLILIRFRASTDRPSA